MKEKTRQPLVKSPERKSGQAAAQYNGSSKSCAPLELGSAIKSESSYKAEILYLETLQVTVFRSMELVYMEVSQIHSSYIEMKSVRSYYSLPGSHPQELRTRYLAH